MNPVADEDRGGSTRQDYLDFAEQAQDSPCLREWALAVADDAEVLALVEDLPAPKRQPNLVLAAARWHGADAVGYAAARGPRAVLLGRWDEVRATVLSRSTQTNEPGRCATLLPVLAGLAGPLALREVGASAGLCLSPDRYSYRYTGSTDRTLHPAGGPSPVVLPCVTEGLPADATLVVFHSAVLAYLTEADRQRFVAAVQDLPGHWVSNEGPRVLPQLAATATSSPPSGSVVGSAPFVLAVDGRAVAWTQGHGRALSWPGPAPGAD